MGPGSPWIFQDFGSSEIPLPYAHATFTVFLSQGPAHFHQALPVCEIPLTRGPKTHINIRIVLFGYQGPIVGIPKTLFVGSSCFCRFLGPLLACLLLLKSTLPTNLCSLFFRADFASRSCTRRPCSTLPLFIKNDLSCPTPSPLYPALYPHPTPPPPPPCPPLPPTPPPPLPCATLPHSASPLKCR